MSKFNYGRSKLTADKLIDKFGASALIRRVTTSTDGWDSASSIVDYGCTAVITGYSQMEAGNDLILSTDRKVLVSALQIEPLPSDRLIAGGIEFQIVSVKALKPASTLVYWEIQARG